MIVYRASSRIRLTLDTSSPLGVGGEAEVLPVLGADGLVAKIYHHADRIDPAKLRLMIANPPSYPDSAVGHTLIAWPLDLLADSEDRFRGFLMPRVKQMRSLIDFYNPSRRRKNYPLFSYRYVHRMAQNLSTAVKVLHNRGYVIGDVNQVNILGNEQALVTLVDTDSFQVGNEAGRIFRCTVGTPEFTPPELSGKAFSQIDRAPEHDLFGLAVLIFRLLMGVHPFDGRYLGSGDPPLLEQRIACGHFTYGRQKGTPYSPPPNALPIEVIDPALRALMEQCFIEGHRDPSKRPDAAVWRAALSDAEDRLSQCRVNPIHFFGRHLLSCPWCERSRLLGGRDPFAPRAPVALTRSATPSEAPPVPISKPRVAPKRRRTASVDFFGLTSLFVGLAGFWFGQWTLLPAGLATLLGLLGIQKSRLAKRTAAVSVLGTIIGLGIIPFGVRRITEADRLDAISRATSGQKDLIQSAAPRQMDEVSQVAAASRQTEKFLRDLTVNDVSGASDTWGPGSATTSLRKQELNNLYYKIKDLGMVQHVDFAKCDVKGSECYMEGVTTFAKGKRHFIDHVSTATTPHLMVSFSIDEPTRPASP